MIAKLGHFQPPKMLLQIYNSLIAPYISYAIVVWGSADKCHLNKIHILKKRLLRFIYFSGGRDHAIPLFLKADILLVTFLYYENICCLMQDVRYEKHLKILSISLQILKLYIHTTRVHLLLAIFTLNTQNYKSSLKHSQDSEQGPGMRYQLF